ncbi:MAG: aspartate/glutamate racemase family protein [Gammaproteobacteria bacterium]
MKIAVINPNSTASMTEKIRAAAAGAAFDGTEIIAANPPDTPASIEGHYDEAVCVPGLLREVLRADAAGADGFVVACFDDPGLGACREVVNGPVVGICEAAMHFAAVIAASFSVVTTLPRAVPIVEELAHRYGMTHKCRKVRAANIPVLALEDGDGAAKIVRAEVLRAAKEDNCEAVILGCAGMADLAKALSAECQMPVLDGVVCALKMCEALVGANLATSKACAYAAKTPMKTKPPMMA